jgi:putative ABC transport system permease protein
MTESLLVAVAGGVLGMGLAWLAQGLLVGFVGRFTSRTAQIAMDGDVLAFALAASVLTGLVFGVAPALASRKNLVRSVREGAAQAGESASRHRLRAGLVVGQVAVSFVLLVGAALLLESFHRLSRVKLGYDTDPVVTASFFGNFTSMNTPEDVLRVHEAILDRVRDVPTITSAAVTSAVPLSNISPGIQLIEIEGGPWGAPQQLQADPNVASEGYFETLGVPLSRGRSFLASDDATRPAVAVVNSSLARLWKGRDPVGSRFHLAGGPPPAPGTDPWITVIGVVPDFQLYQVDQAVEPQFYTTFRQGGGFAGRILARTQGDPHAAVPALADALHRAEAGTPVEEVQTIAELRAGRLAAPRLTAALLGIFAGIALLVTLSGNAGVIGTSVSQRTREFGVRMALGASRSSVLRLVMGEGIVLVLIGLGLGLAGAWAFSRLLARFLYETRPTDLTAYAAVGVALFVAALAASLVPARRATTVQPIVAFKTE